MMIWKNVFETMFFIMVVEVADSDESFRTWDDYFGNGADSGDFTKWYLSPFNPLYLEELENCEKR